MDNGNGGLRSAVFVCAHGAAHFLFFFVFFFLAAFLLPAFLVGFFFATVFAAFFFTAFFFAAGFAFGAGGLAAARRARSAIRCRA